MFALYLMPSFYLIDYSTLNANLAHIQHSYLTSITGNEKFDESNLSQQYGQAIAKQFALPAAITGLFRSPCECQNGVCGCCTGMLFSALRQLGCMNITYHPEDFSFEFKMLMNNAVLYKNRMSGRNPPPVCARIPRLSFIRMCASFYDLKFAGRNMHICMEMSAFFRENEVFTRYVALSLLYFFIVFKSNFFLIFSLQMVHFVCRTDHSIVCVSETKVLKSFDRMEMTMCSKSPAPMPK